MLIDFSTMAPDAIYHCMTQTVIPRPVAWVLTENAGGNFNLAPFSYFTAVSSRPPLILLSMGLKPDGSEKDTKVNIAAREFFVVHIAHRELAGVMTETSRTRPAGESELEHAGLETVPFGDFPLPRLADCRIAMGCRLYQLQRIGDTAQSLVLGEVLTVHVDDAVAHLDERGRLVVDAAAVDPLGRLGASEYATFGEILHIPRPA